MPVTPITVVFIHVAIVAAILATTGGAAFVFAALGFSILALLSELGAAGERARVAREAPPDEQLEL